jgi:coenzyme F420 hydrogenase subunit beta
MTILSIKDVVAWRLCVGCGACVPLCPEKKIRMENKRDDGLRPRLDTAGCESCNECVKICPGVGFDHGIMPERKLDASELMKCWGPILEIWEGHAADPEVRFQGSSGGLATALAAYCLEKRSMGGVLHTGPDPDQPLKNKTHFSRSRAELLERTGSRYAPASPCDGINLIEAASGLSVFIGKGCDVQAIQKAQRIRPELDAKVGLAIGIFCAGTPSEQATLDLIKKGGLNYGDVAEIRYRGRGWPGNFTVRLAGEELERMTLPYMEAWGFLQKYRPYRCYLCPDSTGEFADISCGDPWYREKKVDELGYSLVLVRTKRGKHILEGAIDSGYVVLEKRDPAVLEESQKGMLEKRGAIWGRLLAMKLFGIPTPHYEGFFLYENWLRLPVKEKARSFLGTVKRIVKRGYFRRVKV